MNCRLCGRALGRPYARGVLLDRQIDYFDCAQCGYIQTEQPTWLDDAYASPINASDTGILARNGASTRSVLATLWLLRERRSTVVDYAGGYGLLVRALRDRGINALWHDAYSENLLARGFEHRGERAALVTAFEAFEHFVHPCEELDRMLSIAPNILLGTALVPSPRPQPGEWWYFGPEHGQHIGFFRLGTLRYLAERFGLHLLSNGSGLHLLTAEKHSAAAWRLARKVAGTVPGLLTRGLVSKTEADHRALRKAGTDRERRP